MTITIGGNQYEATKMPPRAVFHVLRKLAPLLGPIGPAVIDLLDETKEKAQVFATLSAQLGPLSQALAYMPDALLDYVMNTCLMYTTRLDSGKWYPTHLDPGTGSPVTPRFADIDAATELKLTAEVIKLNGAGFFAELIGEGASLLSSLPAPPST